MRGELDGKDEQRNDPADINEDLNNTEELSVKIKIDRRNAH